MPPRRGAARKDPRRGADAGEARAVHYGHQDAATLGPVLGWLHKNLNLFPLVFQLPRSSGSKGHLCGSLFYTVTVTSREMEPSRRRGLRGQLELVVTCKARGSCPMTTLSSEEDAGRVRIRTPLE